MFGRPPKACGASVRAKALLVLLGATALGAYYVGRHSNPVSNAPAVQPKPLVARSVAFTATVSPPIAAAATSGAIGNPVPAIKPRPKKIAAHATEKPVPQETKRNAAIVLGHSLDPNQGKSRPISRNAQAIPPR
jgi:hypothetical protein